MGADVEREKQLAAQAAAALVEDGMRVGLGSGSTAAYFVEALAARALDLQCVATSTASEKQALALGLRVEPFAGEGALSQLDVACDGADQVAPNRWTVKGRGGAHTREKIVAAAAERFIVMVSSEKLVERVAPPVPLELASFGLAATIARLGSVRIRQASLTLDGGVLADWLGEVGDPAELAVFLSATPGVVEHGLFPPELVSEVLVGRGDEVVRLG